jgi:hypothetical protein
LLLEKNLIVDMSETTLVDHTVMEKLHDLERDFAAKGLKLRVIGLDEHISLSSHPLSARRRGARRGEPAPEAVHH